jgi:photosystem II stability/assembly factor-like uncharacterized protein
MIVAIAVSGALSIGLSPVHAAGWVNATGTLGGVATECGAVGHSFKVPNTNMVIAGVAGDGLWATTDKGVTWNKLGGSSGNAIKNRPTQMIFDPVSQGTWWECGIYTAPGVFKTTDGGATWSPLGNAWHHDGMAVDLSDPQRKTLLAGGHEQSSTLWKSTNGGSTWTNIGGSLPGGGWSSYPFIIDAQTYLMGIANGGAVYKSNDGGATWSKVCSQTPSSPILKSSIGDLYCSGPNGTILKGSGDGTTWTSISCGAGGFAPVELPGGRIAALGNSGVLISADKGATWKTVPHPLPPAITSMLGGFLYDDVGGAFYAWHWDCSPTTVASDVMWRFDTLFTGTGAVISRPENLSIVKNGVFSRHSVAAVFDASGRMVASKVASREVSIRSKGLEFVRMKDGAIAKGHF